MRLVTALIIAALCFCSSPNNSKPFEACLSGFSGGWVQIYIVNPQVTAPPFTGNMIAKVNNGECTAVNVGDGTTLMACYCFPGSGISSATKKVTTIVRSGDSWNL
jgi:hypothetical protein